MITKKDAISYFNQMITTEKQMENFYLRLIKKIKDKTLIRVFSGIAKEEKIHGEKIQELKDLLDKYWKG